MVEDPKRQPCHALGVRARAISACLVCGAVALVGCASTSSGERRPARNAESIRFVADYAHVPAPPAGLPDNIVEIWEALRRGEGMVVQQQLALLPGDEAESAAARTLEGFLALASGASTSAGTAFQQAVSITPDFAPALYGLGYVAEAGGARSAAIERYRQALAADGALAEAQVRLRSLELEAAQAHLVQGELAEEAGDDEGATRAYQDSIRLGPSLLRPYLRLAALHTRAGDDDEAVRVLRDAYDRVGARREVLEPLGLALQRTGAHAQAYDMFQRLREIAPQDPEVRALVTEARRLYETTSLPEPYRRLEDKEILQREDLAALLAIRIPALEDVVEEPRKGIIMTDISDSWAAPYIRDVVEWGLMSVYQNHAFYPEVEVQRQLFAEVAYRVLELLDAADDAPRPRLVDVPRGHFFYDEIQAVVGRGILELDSRGEFGILERVSGAEAIAAIQRLARLARARGL